MNPQAKEMADALRLFSKRAENCALGMATVAAYIGDAFGGDEAEARQVYADNLRHAADSLAELQYSIMMAYDDNAEALRELKRR